MEAEVESDDLEARAARMAEEFRKEKGALRDHAFLLSHVASPNGVLRTQVRKQQLHRWKWNGTTPEDALYRMDKGTIGCVALAADSGRTESWVPRDHKDIPTGEVTLSPQDVVYYVLSVMQDDAGPPQRGEQVKDSLGRRMADLETVMGKLMGNTDEAIVWMKDAHSKKRRGVTPVSPSQPVADLTNDSWEILRNAIVCPCRPPSRATG